VRALPAFARPGLMLCACAAFAPLDAQRDSMFTRPRRFESIRSVPGTLATSARDVARRSSISKALLIGASTVALYAADERIYAESRRLGNTLGLAPEHPEWALRVSGVKLFYVPTTVSSGFYYLGDGWTTMAVAGTFFAVGTVRKDNRALRTASEITGSMFALGIVTQSLKHLTGRQTPSAATVPRGKWRPLAGWHDYSANTPQYDAFPSGHLATAMATVTVIAENYPDNRWVRPIGYSLMTGLSFAMVNNGVHWASDYPLALAIGGTIGHAAARRGRVATGVAGGLEPFVTPTTVGLRARF
jgi:hypothetical protein